MKNMKRQLQIGFVLTSVTIVVSIFGCRNSETPITNTNKSSLATSTENTSGREAASTIPAGAAEGQRGEGATDLTGKSASGETAASGAATLTEAQLTSRELSQSSAGRPNPSFLSRATTCSATVKFNQPIYPFNSCIAEYLGKKYYSNIALTPKVAPVTLKWNSVPCSAKDVKLTMAVSTEFVVK